MAVDVIVPKLGPAMETGTIVGWLKEDGARVAEGEAIAQIETDKAVVEIPAPVDGTLHRADVPEGVPVPVATVIALISTPGEQLSAPPVPKQEGMATAQPGQPRVLATPAARRVARELGVDLSAVKGSGPEGRIKEADVRALGVQAAPPRPATPVATKVAQLMGIDLNRVEGTGPGGRIVQEDVLKAAAGSSDAGRAPLAAAPAVSYLPVAERVSLSDIRAATARRMAESFQTIPHFSLSVEVDMGEAIRMRERLLEAFRQKSGARLTFTAVLVRCLGQALREHPDVNASYADGAVDRYQNVNVGVAMATARGLLVPVVRDADRKTLAQIADAVATLENRAVELKFRPEDLSGGTFTLSNLGMFGISEFTAIINPPEAAILAVGQIVDRPVAREGAVVVRPIMKMTLSVDHRVLDGVSAAAFLRDVKALLENPYLLV